VPLLLPDDDPCSFCDYLAGHRPYTVLDRDDVTATLVTREQRGRGHLLVIPVAHRETILDLAAQDEAALMTAVTRAARLIAAAIDPPGIAVWQNNGIPAHQSVPHVHVHVAGTLPGGGTEWGPVPTLTVTETDRIAAELLAAGATARD
jgi:histidine triad (HIT) family protein